MSEVAAYCKSNFKKCDVSFHRILTYRNKGKTEVLAPDINYMTRNIVHKKTQISCKILIPRHSSQK